MNAHVAEEVEQSFTSDLIDLGAVSLRALRELDGAELRVALERVVQQTGRSTKSIAGCSSAKGID
jgi:FXSXX-COOH protein